MKGIKREFVLKVLNEGLTKTRKGYYKAKQTYDDRAELYFSYGRYGEYRYVGSIKL